MNIPFYISFTEFQKNYQSDFDKWKLIFTEGREVDFLWELKAIYNNYGEAFFQRLLEHEFTIIQKEIDFRDLDSNTIKILFHIHDSDLLNDDFDFRISQIDYNKLKNVQISFRQIKEWVEDKIKEVRKESLGAGNIQGLLEDEDKQKKSWFKVGLKFADGTIKYQTIGRPSFAVITENAGLKKTMKPYVSSTYNNNESDKNIFRSKNKMEALRRYCTEKNISISEWFLEELKKHEYII